MIRKRSDSPGERRVRFKDEVLDSKELAESLPDVKVESLPDLESVPVVKTEEDVGMSSSGELGAQELADMRVTTASNEEEFDPSMSIKDYIRKYTVSCEDFKEPEVTFDPRLVESYNNADKEERRDLLKKLEEQALSSASCRVTNPSVYQDDKIQMDTIRRPTLINVLEEMGMNADIQKAISCAITAIVENNLGTYDMITTDSFKYYFPSLSMIGNPSIEGYAFAAIFYDLRDIFVIKTPREDRVDNLIHEAVIGMLVTNKIRKFVPNFMYVYGFTKCASMQVYSKAVISWCTSEFGSSYLITENIKNSTTLNDFIRKNNSYKDFLAVFTQLINALYIAYKKYKYTHYDLHLANVLVRKYKKNIAIPFYFNESIIGYISNSNVAYIIDYGMSKADIGGLKVGHSRFDYFVEKELYDVYRLTVMLGHDTMSKVNSEYKIKVWNFLNRIYSFFDTEESLSFRIARKEKDPKDRYFPSVKHYKSFDSFYIYLQGLDLNLYSSTDVNLMGAVIPVNNRINNCEFIDKLGEGVPLTAEDYCSLINNIRKDDRFPEEVKINMKRYIDSKFNAYEWFNTEKGYVDKIFTNLVEVSSLKNDQGGLLTDLNLVEESIRRSESFVKRYEVELYIVIGMKEKLFKLGNFLKNCECALSLQNSYIQLLPYFLSVYDSKREWDSFVEYQRALAVDNLNVVTENADPKVKLFWDRDRVMLVQQL